MPETLEKKSEVEKKEHGPKISMHIFYSSHGTAKDYENLKKAFEKADIYVPEIHGWTPSDLDDLNRISQGEAMPRKASPGEDPESDVDVFEEQMIYNSKKPIILADIPQSLEATVERQNIEKLDNKVYESFVDGEFSECLRFAREYVVTKANAILKREQAIKQNLKKQVQQFFNNNPEYANKKEVNILIALGSVHTKLYHDFKKSREQISREFSDMPYVYGLSEEATRRVLFSKEVKDDLLAKGIAGVFLGTYLYRLSNNSHKIDKVIHLLLDSLTLEDIEQISKNTARARIGFLGRRYIDRVCEELASYGIPIPKDEQEMDVLLEKGKK
ncbi:hypothetical protein MYX07_06480 [Patescibacteria group bacterium AH-259-L07]|nr:hypothetical protein [Patescibacteria group bacterium AH-259-L07]